MIHLETLYLNDTSLTGRIPTELGLLQNANSISLEVRWCMFCRNISISLRWVILLDHVNKLNYELTLVQMNQLTGDLPTELANLEDTLTYFYIAVCVHLLFITMFSLLK